MVKCPLCLNKKVVYTPRIHLYENKKNKRIEIQDWGYWDVCTCQKKIKVVKLKNGRNSRTA